MIISQVTTSTDAKLMSSIQKTHLKMKEMREKKEKAEKIQKEQE